MEVSTLIDWISVTHKNRANHMHEDINQDYITGNGRNGYTQGKQYLCGIVELMNPERPDMGIHMIYSGKTLARIYSDFGVSSDDILLHHIANNGKISRIDFAVDAMNSGLELDELWEALEGKQAKTRSSHSRSQSGNNKGYTVYIGSRKTRKKMVRAYDKALDLNFDNIDYKRIELEMRQDVARNAVKSYLHNELSTDTIFGMIKSVVDFPENETWQSIFNHPTVKVPVAPSGDGDTETWLLKQVAPALAKTIAYNPDFLERFNNALGFHMQKNVIREA